MKKKVVLIISTLILTTLIVFVSYVLFMASPTNEMYYEEWLEPTLITGAHRGDSVNYIENTLPAFKAALINDSFKFIEFDIQYTKDKILIVHHDLNLLRTQKNPAEIPKINYSELLDKSDYYIPTYNEVMDIVTGKKPLNIEIKSQGNLTEDKEIADFIIKDLEERGILNTTLISSISQDLIYYINNKYNNFQGLYAEEAINNFSYYNDKEKINTGIIFYVTLNTFKEIAPFFCETLPFCTNYNSLDIIMELSKSGANYLMMHESNNRFYENLRRGIRNDEKVVFWTFGNEMHLLLPNKYKNTKITKEVAPWWED